jgi:hypothetical protein
MKSPKLKLLICLALVSAGCRSPFGPGHPVSLKDAAAQGAAKIKESTERPKYVEGFKNGATMIDLALHSGCKPYFLKVVDGSDLQTPTGTLPPGAKAVEMPPKPEADPVTGLPIRWMYEGYLDTLDRGMVDGFQWALASQTQALTRANLIAASPVPAPPGEWLPWPAGKEEVIDQGNHRHVFWAPGILAWEFNDKGFPVQRVWRHAPDWLHPQAVAFQGDVLWVKTQGMGAVALGLTSGLIRSVQADATAVPVPVPVPAAPQEANPASHPTAPEAPAPEDRMGQLRREAMAGQAESMYQLAKDMVRNTNDPDSLGLRFLWMLEAARRGHVRAMMDVAGFYYSGVGVPKDLEEARVWSERAARSGNPDAVKAKDFLFPKP